MNSNYSAEVREVLTLYDGDSNQAPIYKKNCGVSSTKNFTSSSNVVLVNFQSDNPSRKDPCIRWGFKLEYISLGK